MNKGVGTVRVAVTPKNRKTSSGGKTPQKQLVVNKAQKQVASSKGGGNAETLPHKPH